MSNGAGGTGFPALLPLGNQQISLEDLRQMCVGGFPLSTTRERIMLGLEQVVVHLRSLAIQGELWIDGSFVTQKINPNDVDMVLFMQGLFYESATADQKQAIDWVGSNLKSSHCCDSYISYEWPDSHPLHSVGIYFHDYWLKWWSHGRGATSPTKGVAVVVL